MMAAERTRIYKARKTDIFQDNKTSREFLCESTGEELKHIIVFPMKLEFPEREPEISLPYQKNLGHIWYISIR